MLLLFPTLQGAGEGRRGAAAVEGDQKGPLPPLGLLLLLETAPLFSGKKLHILFFSQCKKNGSGALMGMFLSNVVFPPPASGTVTFYSFTFL